MDMGRRNWLDRARWTCCAGGGGFWRSEDLGGDGGLGGSWGCMGIARPTVSVCPLAFSTLGLLNKLKRDRRELLRSSGGSGFSDLMMAGAGADWAFWSSRFALDRLRRQREVEKVSLGAMAALAVKEPRVSTHPVGGRCRVSVSDGRRYILGHVTKAGQGVYMSTDGMGEETKACQCWANYVLGGYQS